MPGFLRAAGSIGAALLLCACGAERSAGELTTGSSPADRALARGREALELARRSSEEGSDPFAPLLDARAAYAEALATRPDDAAALLEAALVEQSLGETAATRDLLLRHCAARSRRWIEDPDLDRLESGVFAEASLPAAAAKAAARALRRNPEDVSLHQRLIDLGCAAGEVEWLAVIYAELRAAAPRSATVAWYVGYVDLLAGDRARRERRFPAARAGYESARRGLAAAAERERSYAEMTRRIDHLAVLGLAWIAREEGDLATAERLFLGQLALAQDLKDVMDGLDRSLMDALLFLGADLERAGDFAAGARLARAVVTALSQEPGLASWWNNLGYFLREHASRVEAGRESGVEGDAKAAARGLFRESWLAYLEASRLAPDDARIVNDTALIQVYHLQDDLGRAKELLQRAIRTGEEQLSRMGENPPEARRFPVAQAVGDAWLNLGYLYYHLEKDWPKARDCFERSIATHSGARGENRAYIDSIDGKSEPLPARAAAAFVNAPSPGDPPRAQVAWERGLESALALAAEENRAVFVYCRGDGLTLGVPFFDDAVTRKPLADAVTGLVCVVADKARHNRVDRDARGRRILCPRFGAVTCGEHRRSCDELLARWPALRREGEGAEPSEGFLAIAPCGRRLEAGGAGFGRFGQEFASLQEELGPRRPPLDLAALTTDVLWNEGPAQLSAAERLVGSPSAMAREVVEALLGVGDRDALPIGGGQGHELVVAGSAARALLDALARRAAPEDVELLLALAGNRGEPLVAALALDRLPARSDPAPVERLLQWSDEARVREAAARALLRLDGCADRREWIELVEAAAALPG